MEEKKGKRKAVNSIASSNNDANPAAKKQQRRMPAVTVKPAQMKRMMFRARRRCGLWQLVLHNTKM